MRFCESFVVNGAAAVKLPKILTKLHRQLVVLVETSSLKGFASLYIPHDSNRGEQRFIESIPHNWQFSEHGQFGLAELHSSHYKIIQRWKILAFTHKDN